MIEKSNIKEAYYYLKSKGYINSHQDIADEMGYSRSSVSKAIAGVSTYLTDDFLNAFYRTFCDRLVGFGDGFVLSPSEQKKEPENQDPSFAPFLKLISEKDITVREQAEEIGQLKEQVRQLTIEKERLASNHQSRLISRK